MTHHSSYRKRLHRNRKGYSAIIATIIMVLIILYLYFNVSMFALNRDRDFQDMTSRSQQLDADRNAEQLLISDIIIDQGGQPGQIAVTCTLTNTGTVPVQMARLWVKDNSSPQNNVGNVALLTPPVLLQPGGSITRTFPPVTLVGALASDSFYIWLVTFRGNSFSRTAN